MERTRHRGSRELFIEPVYQGEKSYYRQQHRAAQTPKPQCGKLFNYSFATPYPCTKPMAPAHVFRRICTQAKPETLSKGSCCDRRTMVCLCSTLGQAISPPDATFPPPSPPKLGLLRHINVPSPRYPSSSCCLSSTNLGRHKRSSLQRSLMGPFPAGKAMLTSQGLQGRVGGFTEPFWLENPFKVNKSNCALTLPSLVLGHISGMCANSHWIL